MYWNVWTMYGNDFKIKLCKMMPLYNVNVMYSKVVELEITYINSKNHSKIS